MTPGLVAFFVVIACLLASYALFAPDNAEALQRVENDQSANQAGGEGLFEKWVRPAVRNLIPQSPAALTEYARRSDGVSGLLARSGNPWRITPEEYLVLRLLATGVASVLMVFMTVVGYVNLPTPLALGLGAFVGQLVPKVLHDSAWSKRRRDLNATLPEALDLLRICMNAGYNFPNALAQSVLLLPPGTTRDELGRVSAELRAGRTISASLESMLVRCPTDGVDAFVRAIVQAQNTGSDMAATLSYQSEETRANYERAVEIRAQKLQTTLFLPIIAMFLPTLLIFMFGPSMSQLANAF